MPEVDLDAEDTEEAVERIVPIIPSGQHRGKTVDAVWAEDPQYVWFLSQLGLTHVQLLRYKAFFEACGQVPGKSKIVERALELTEGLSMPAPRAHQMPSSTFRPNGWRGW
jgi:hypothetical protein